MVALGLMAGCDDSASGGSFGTATLTLNCDGEETRYTFYIASQAVECDSESSQCETSPVVYYLAENILGTPGTPGENMDLVMASNQAFIQSYSSSDSTRWMLQDAFSDEASQNELQSSFPGTSIFAITIPYLSERLEAGILSIRNTFLLEDFSFERGYLFATPTDEAAREFETPLPNSSGDELVFAYSGTTADESCTLSGTIRLKPEVRESCL